jgi:serine/threonine-protein kinase
VIHCDLKPNNLIRRTSDGRLVLIDFGATYSIHPTRLKQQFASIQPSKAPLTIRPLGYIPPEQLNGQPYPNSDLYALGMIALQALTGLNPGQLQAEPDTGKVNWQQHVSVSDPLASVLNRMVLYDFKHRYQSATYARTALKRLTDQYSGARSKHEQRGVIQPLSFSCTTAKPTSQHRTLGSWCLCRCICAFLLAQATPPSDGNRGWDGNV